MSLGLQNLTLRGREMKYFPAPAGKILLILAVLATLSACQSVSADSGPNTRKAHTEQIQQVPVVAPAGSVLRVRLDQALDTERSRPGDRFTGELVSPVSAAGKDLLPEGTIVQGHVLNAHPSGRLKGRAELSLVLDSCQLGGRAVPIETNPVTRISRRHHKRNLTLIGGGLGAGALIGGLVAGPGGALIGAGSGAAAGTAGAFVTGKRQVFMPAETVAGFTLKRSAQMAPVGERQ
jgi:hypothetical protein